MRPSPSISPRAGLFASQENRHEPDVRCRAPLHFFSHFTVICHRGHSMTPAPLSPSSIDTELVWLRQLTSSLAAKAEQASIDQHLNALSDLIERLRVGAARAVFTLTTIDDGLEGLLDLLQRDDEQPLPAHQLSGLLAPLHQQVQYANSEASHLLYALLDNTSTGPVALALLLMPEGKTGNASDLD